MRYAILILILAFALPVDAERRYFVQTSDSKIVGLTDDDGAELLPGTTAVLESTIRAATPPGADGDIIILGKWDGVNYTAPSGDGIVVPLDLTTDVGMLKEAAYLAHDQLIAWREALEAVSLYYPAEDVAVGHDFLTFGHQGRSRRYAVHPLERCGAGEVRRGNGDGSSGRDHAGGVFRVDRAGAGGRTDGTI